VSDTILVRHPGLDTVVEIPAAGLAQYRQGGWEPLTDDEVTAREQAYLDERAAAAAQLDAAAQPAEPEPEPAAPSDPEPAAPGPRKSRRSTTSEEQ
jgi:hypothetical protein